MYANCLFCSADLGTNEAIESFPVGARIAFDAWKGRLWAVCPVCIRWNLAPIEERWEAVEAAERLFTDTRTRVQSENIGLCRLRDGTRLIRVGRALPGELAAWRYGTQLVSRRRRNLLGGAAVGVGVAAVAAGMPLIASAGVPLAAVSLGLNAASQWRIHQQRRRIVQHIDADASPAGVPLVIRRMHLYDAVLTPVGEGESAEIGVQLPPPVAAANLRSARRPAAGPILVTGDAARRLLARSMTDYNSRGARQADVELALAQLEGSGGAENFTRRIAESGAALARGRKWGRSATQTYSLRQILGTFRGEILPVQRYRDPFRDEPRPQLRDIEALALEMALNEESERRALAGELAALEAAWREAEEIARIADALPGEPGSA